MDFPVGTVLVKNFRLGARRVETRLFMRHTNGKWAGYTYEWNAQGTDATRVIGGKMASVAGQGWIFPSEAQCLACHTEAAGRSLGLEFANSMACSRDRQTGRTANQVVTLNAIGVLNPAVATAPPALPSMPDPYGTSGTLDERARAYLHTNCSHCHRPDGGTPTMTSTCVTRRRSVPRTAVTGIPRPVISASPVLGSSLPAMPRARCWSRARIGVMRSACRR